VAVLAAACHAAPAPSQPDTSQPDATHANTASVDASATDAPTGTERIADVIAPDEVSKVLAATFTRYSSGPCPDIPELARADTWTKLDDLQERAYRAGLFRPRIQQRILGDFTAPKADEALYWIDVGDCARTDFRHQVTVIFQRSELAKDRPAVRLRLERHTMVHVLVVDVVKRDGLDVLIAESGRKRVSLRLAPSRTWFEEPL